MKRAALRVLLLAALAALPGCGADTGDGLGAFGAEAEDREEAHYSSHDHPSGDVHLHLREDGSFLLEMKPWHGATLRAKAETLEGRWRIDDGVLMLSHGKDLKQVLRYRQGMLPKGEIPGWQEDLRGLDFLDGTLKTFASGFNLVDDVELERVMESVLKGD